MVGSKSILSSAELQGHHDLKHRSSALSMGLSNHDQETLRGEYTISPWPFFPGPDHPLD